MMIDPAKSPATALFADRYKRSIRDVPGLRDLLESVAELERVALDARAKISVHHSFLLALDRYLPRTVNQDLMSHVEARQKLVQIRSLVNEVQSTLGEIQ